MVADTTNTTGTSDADVEITDVTDTTMVSDGDQTDHVDTTAEQNKSVPSFLEKTIGNLAVLLLVTAVLSGGFVFYVEYFSSWVNSKQQNSLAHSLHGENWREANGGTRSIDPEDVVLEDIDFTTGDPFAQLRMPAIGVSATVVEGVGQKELAQGPGRFNDSVRPGEEGNFSLAAHRVGQGSHFNRIGELKACDTVDVETAEYIYHYNVVGDGDCFTKEQRGLQQEYDIPTTRIVTPHDYSVTDPIPWVETEGWEEPEGADGQWLTMVTCEPEWGNWERLITHAQLTSVTEK